MSRYLVKLKPVESFFFGGERGFGFLKDENKLKNNIVKSREFPQQTSILGMVRKEILILNESIKEKWDYNPDEIRKNNKLIGKRSFNIESENEDFGIINNISPVFIIKETEGNDKFLIKIPKDHNKNASSKTYSPLKYSDKEGNYLKVKTNLSKEVYLPIDFKAKKGISEDFVDVQTGHIINKDEVFIKDCSIGIKLDENHLTKDNSLFRLEKYKFNYDRNYEKENKCFAFLLDIEDGKLKKTFENYKNVVSLGGEGSYFFISFEKITFKFKEKIKFLNDRSKFFYIKKDEKRIYKIILLSDTYIPKNIYDKSCNYSISTKINFRSLQSENYDKNKFYYKRFCKNKRKYSFLEKGSVLFTDEDNYNKLVKSINNSKFQKIGYNIFI